jgi:hypothetical protein
MNIDLAIKAFRYVLKKRNCEFYADIIDGIANETYTPIKHDNSKLAIMLSNVREVEFYTKIFHGMPMSWKYENDDNDIIANNIEIIDLGLQISGECLIDLVKLYDEIFEDAKTIASIMYNITMHIKMVNIMKNVKKIDIFEN